MRQPSSFSQLYGWWQGAIAGRWKVSDHDADARCGWYKTRFWRDGPWVPVEIKCWRNVDPDTGELTEDERLVAIVNGEEKDPGPMWTYLRPITKKAFDALTEAREATSHRRNDHAPYDLIENVARP